MLTNHGLRLTKILYVMVNNAVKIIFFCKTFLHFSFHFLQFTRKQ